MSESVDIATVCKESKSKHAPGIVSVISNTINTLPPTKDSAEKTASEIDNLYASEPLEAENWLWTFWSIFVGVASMIPAHDERHELLALTVAELKTKRDDEVEMWGQRTRVWSELPMLGPIMRDAWSCE